MNAALTLDIQGNFLPQIKNKAEDYCLDLDDAKQEAWCAIGMAIQSFNPSRGTLDAWVATNIDIKLRQLAYGHSFDPLLFASELDDDLAVENQEQDDQEIPPLAGIYGRIRDLALRGKDTKEIATSLRLTRRRVEQLLADKAAIRDAVRFAQVQRDLFEGVMA
ncbi:hypothetical protein [Sulfuricella sp.]|uniref:hypothetical protein n=1 Tax=Sulfuricella sp. TaxID=2099377 RepID=UPI002C65E1A7|nr:hypothetical protein [Sulfuricella sp.]HUX64321.1 hypothetical protein [Sulfuricella sp.]